MVEHKQYASSSLSTGLRSNRLLFARLVSLLVVVMLAGGANARYPLEPMDTSSPRATMESFLALTDEAARRFVEYRDAPGPATQQALLQSLAKGPRLSASTGSWRPTLNGAQTSFPSRPSRKRGHKKGSSIIVTV